MQILTNEYQAICRRSNKKLGKEKATGPCGTVTLFQQQENATLLVSTLSQLFHMKVNSWSDFLMTLYGV